MEPVHAPPHSKHHGMATPTLVRTGANTKTHRLRAQVTESTAQPRQPAHNIDSRKADWWVWYVLTCQGTDPLMRSMTADHEEHDGRQAHQSHNRWWSLSNRHKVLLAHTLIEAVPPHRRLHKPGLLNRISPLSSDLA